MFVFTRLCSRLCLAAILFALAPHGVRAQDAAPSVTLEGRAVTVPVTIDHAHLYVSVEVNGKPARLVLDSGAAADVLSLDAAKRLGVTALDPKQNISVSGAGGTQRIWLANLDSLKVDGAALSHSTVILVDLPPVLKADGLIGYEFLHRFVTTVDYQAKTVTFRDAAPAPIPAGAQTLPFVLTGNIPCIEAELDGARGRFQIDTGDGGSIDVNTPFVKRNRLDKKYPRHFEMVSGVGVGGEIRSSTVRIGNLKLGSETIPDLIADLSLQKTGVFAESGIAGTLGYDVLSRFRITLDYTASTVTLENAAGPPPPSDYNRSGVGFSISGTAPAVTDIVPGGPGEAAGVKRGDEVVEVNGTPIDSLSVMILSQAFRGAPGSRVALKLRAPDKSLRDVIVTLRELL